MSREAIIKIKVRILLWTVMLRKEAKEVRRTAKVRPRHLKLLKSRSVLDSVVPWTDLKH